MLVHNPEKLRWFYENELWNDNIPFWMEHSPDRKHGGYFTCLRADGSVYDTDKFVWLQARQVWMLSKFYNTLARRREFLEMAELGANFLRKHGRDKNGDWYFSLTREGRPLVQPYNIFSDCFAAMAFAEYGRASGEKWATDLAVHTFERIQKRQAHPKGKYNKLVPGTRPMRSLSLPMITVNLAQELGGAVPGYNVEKVTRDNIKTVMDLFVDKKTKIVYENVKPNGKHFDSFEGRLLNPGHGIESMWFIMNAADKMGDDKMVRRASDSLLAQMKFCWDTQYGGFLYFKDVQGDPPQQLEWDQKLWWVHMESLIACLMAWHLTGRREFAAWYDRVHDYTWKHFPDRRYGEWWGYLNRQGQVLLPLKGGKWKGCFHIPRGLLCCMNILNRMIKKSSKARTHILLGRKD